MHIGIFQSSGVLAHGKVFNRPRAFCHLLRKCHLFEVGSSVQVPEQGIGLVTEAVNTSFLLNSLTWFSRQAQVNEDSLVLAGRIMEGNTSLPGIGLNKNDLNRAVIVVKRFNGRASFLFGKGAIVDCNTLSKSVTQCLNGRFQRGKFQMK